MKSAARCALLAGVLACLLSAQTPVATLVGRVTDATGAAVPAADVRVRNLDTNAMRAVQSDGAGDYVVANLSPGRYEVTVDRQGFRRLVETGLELQVNQTARLDARLQVGALSEAVEVSAAAPLLNTENAVKGDVVVHQEIIEMPLNGRSVEDLAFLVPEVADASDSNSGSSMAANGAQR